jgi:hypothetical protein
MRCPVRILSDNHLLWQDFLCFPQAIQKNEDHHLSHTYSSLDILCHSKLWEYNVCSWNIMSEVRHHNNSDSVSTSQKTYPISIRNLWITNMFAEVVALYCIMKHTLWQNAEFSNVSNDTDSNHCALKFFKNQYLVLLLHWRYNLLQTEHCTSIMLYAYLRVMNRHLQ